MTNEARRKELANSPQYVFAGRCQNCGEKNVWKDVIEITKCKKCGITMMAEAGHMCEEDAIKKLEIQIKETANKGELFIALMTAIGALKTRIGRVPGTDGTHRYCPTCGQYFGKQHPHCWNCGQKLDWGDNKVDNPKSNLDNEGDNNETPN